MNTSSLATELSAYREKLPQLIEQHGVGKFAVFLGKTCLGVFETARDALIRGNTEAKNRRFLMRQISETEPVAHLASFLEVK